MYRYMWNIACTSIKATYNIAKFLFHIPGILDVQRSNLNSSTVKFILIIYSDSTQFNIVQGISFTYSSLFYVSCDKRENENFKKTHCCMAPLSVVRLLQMSAAVWDSRAKVEAISQQKKSIENKFLNIIYTGTFTSFVFYMYLVKW